MKTTLIYLFINIVALSFCLGQGPASEIDARYTCEELLDLRTDRTVYVAGDRIWVQVRTINALTGHLQGASTIAYVELLDNLNEPVIRLKSSLIEGCGYVCLLLPDTIASGSYSLCAYTKWMENFGEEHFAKRTVRIVNSFTIGEDVAALAIHDPGAGLSFDSEVAALLSVQLTKDRYQKREKVKAVISGFPEEMLLSVSVYKVDALDSLLATRKSASVRSLVPPSPIQVNELSYSPELNGAIITGIVKHKQTNAILKNKAIYLSIPGKQPQCYIATSDSSGRVTFEAPAYFGEGDIMLQPATPDSITTVYIDDPFFQHPVKPAGDLQQFALNSNIRRAIDQRHLALQVYRTYMQDSVARQAALPVFDSLPFIGSPDEKFNLDDYTRFTTLEEVFREYVPTVMVRKHRDGLHLLALNKNEGKFFDTDPLVLLDGVPVFNNRTFFSYDPLKIKTGSVRANRYYYGPGAYEGVVFLQTYRGNLDGFELDNYVSAQEYNGMQRPPKFYEPVYDDQWKKASRIPDYRYLLYWQPWLQGNKQSSTGIEFYTNDLEGTYVVKVEGYDKEGKLCHGESVLFVE